MWTQYPPPYHDGYGHTTAAQWCEAWRVPVSGDFATIWIWTSTATGKALGGQTTEPNDIVTDVTAWAPSPWVYYGHYRAGLVTWKAATVPVTSLQPILASTGCAHLLAGATIVGEVPPPSLMSTLGVDRFGRINAWAHARNLW